MGLLCWLRRLYSLDTLDSRFTVSSNAPLKDAAESRPQGAAKGGSGAAAAAATRTGDDTHPSKWNTLEFYVYFVVVFLAVVMMFKTVIGVSKGEPRWSVNRARDILTDRHTSI